MLSHALGYVGRINAEELEHLDSGNYAGTHFIGKTGVENFYEKELHGQAGLRKVETNARGRVLRELDHTDPVPGKDLTLTLDKPLQKLAVDLLDGRRGAIVAIAPQTGEILAMASVPGFDSNQFVTGIDVAPIAPCSRISTCRCSIAPLVAAIRPARRSSRSWPWPACERA